MCVSFRFVFEKNIKIKIKIGGRRSHGGHAAEGKRARDREKEEVSTTKAFISNNSGVLRAEICQGCDTFVWCAHVLRGKWWRSGRAAVGSQLT